MKDGPFSDQSQRRPRLNISHGHLASEIELALLALMFGVKMQRFVFLVVHPDDDSKEHRNDRHALSMASSTGPVGPTIALTGRRGAERRWYPTATLLGGPVQRGG